MLQNMAFPEAARERTWNLTFNFTNDQEDMLIWKKSYTDVKNKIHCATIC